MSDHAIAPPSDALQVSVASPNSPPQYPDIIEPYDLLKMQLYTEREARIEAEVVNLRAQLQQVRDERAQFNGLLAKKYGVRDQSKINIKTGQIVSR